MSSFDKTLEADTASHQVIEFFGLPGIGKTTVAHRVTEGLRGNGWPLIAGHEAFDEEMSNARRHLARGQLILSEIPSLLSRRSTIGHFSGLANQSLKARTKAFYNTLTLTAQIQKARRQQRPLLLDQGIAQAAWSVLNFSSGDLATTQWIAPKRNWSPLIVSLTAPMDVVINRIGARYSHHSRMQDEPADWVRAKESETAVLSAIKPLVDSGQIRMLQYTADGISPQELASQIVSDIVAD